MLVPLSTGMAPRPVSTTHLVPTIPQSLKQSMQEDRRDPPETPQSASHVSHTLIEPDGPVETSRQVERQNTQDSSVSQETPAPPPKANDPYAGLDSAFGNYVADQPRPGGSRPGEFDDLLL
jgi:AP-2 complex subunit beta-1